MWPRGCSPFAYGHATATRIGRGPGLSLGDAGMDPRLRGWRNSPGGIRLLALGHPLRRALGRRPGLLRRRLGGGPGLLPQVVEDLLRLVPVLGRVELLRLGDELLALRAGGIRLELLERERHAGHFYPTKPTAVLSAGERVRCAVGHSKPQPGGWGHHRGVDFDMPSEDDPRRVAVRTWLAEHPTPSGRELAEAGY